jgi:hypothetical protein
VLIAAFALAACASQPIDAPVPVDATVPVTTPGATNPNTVTTRQVDAGIEALERARARWATAGLETYSYRFVDDCGECEQLPMRLAVVWSGAVQDPLGRAVSVEEAFALIERALERGADVDVTYDEALGYPTDLWIDREARAYDGGTHLLFSDLEAGLPGEPASLEAHREARARWEAAGLTSYEYSSAVVCDCAYQVSMRTRVVDGLVTDFDTRTPEPTDITFSPLTIAQMFDDVEAFLSGEDFPDEGIRVTGSAHYDDEYGYPTWIGLDIEVIDAEAAAEAGLPPRLVLTVSDLERLNPDPGGDLSAARAKWVAAGLDTYTFDIEFHDVVTADYSETLTVRVESGIIVSVSEDGTEYLPGDVEVPTVDELFDALGSWQLSGREFDAIYDSELGYPAVVVVTDDPEGTMSIRIHR